MIQFFLRCAFESQCTFENVDSIVVASQFEGEGCMMRLEDAQVVVQNGQLAAGIAHEDEEEAATAASSSSSSSLLS